MWFDTANLIAFSDEINKTGKKHVKIIVGHYPLDFCGGVEFVSNVESGEFKAYFHGHTHMDSSVGYLKPQNPNETLISIGAGSFGASGKALWQGVGNRYNIVKMSEQDVHSVETFTRNTSNSPWIPAYIYFEREKGGGALSNKWILAKED